MTNRFRKHWRSIAIGVLCFALVLLGDHYFELATKYEEAQSDYEWAQESLERSVKELAETRKKLVPRDFGSYEEMEAWVVEWEAENKPIAVSILNHTFHISGNKDLYSHYWDCDDIAEAMQRDARIDGIAMDRALTDSRGAVCDTKVSPHSFHAGCMAKTDNFFWWIEPQTGGIVRIVGID